LAAFVGWRFAGALTTCDLHAQDSAIGVSQSSARATEPPINETRPNNASVRYFIWFDMESSPLRANARSR